MRPPDPEPLGNGDDVFHDNVYSWYAWSAEIVQGPFGLRKAVDDLNIIGRKIKSLRTIGGAFNFNEYEEEVDEFGDVCGEQTDPLRTVLIDEPVVIFFEDGDRVEIDFSEGSSVRISMNCIPERIRHRVKSVNFDANRLFSCFIGQCIVGFEVLETETMPVFTGSYGMSFYPSETYIDQLNFLLENGVKISFEAYFDYGTLTALDKNGLVLPISREYWDAALFKSPDAGSDFAFNNQDL